MKRTVVLLTCILISLFSACTAVKKENVTIQLDADIVYKTDRLDVAEYELQFNKMMELIDTMKSSDFIVDVSYQLYIKVHGVNISDGISLNEPSMFPGEELISLIEEGKIDEIINSSEYFEELTRYCQTQKDRYYVLCGIGNTDIYDIKEGMIRTEDNHSSKVNGRWFTQQEIDSGEMVCSIGTEQPLIFEEYTYGNSDNVVCLLDYDMIDGDITDIYSYCFKVIGHYTRKGNSDEWDHRIYIPEKALLKIHENQKQNSIVNDSSERLYINNIYIKLNKEQDIRSLENLIRQKYSDLKGIRIIRQ